MTRQRISLCGLFRYQPDLAWEGEQAGYQTIGYDDRRWREARLPNVFDRLHPGLDAYEGAVWFRRKVTVPADWDGKRVDLCFQAVNYHATVWVNGRQVGEHADGFLPFACPVHDHLVFGGENVVVVRADNTRREGEVPGLQRGWRTYGGILREVDLVAMGRLYLDHVAIEAEPVRDGGRLAVCAEVRNERPQAADVTMSVRVTDGGGADCAALGSRSVRVEAGGVSVVSLEGTVAGVTPWSPNEPSLYQAEVTLLSEGQPADRQDVRFGFRRIEASRGELLLNGRAIYLTGFNRHEDSPGRDGAADLETARCDLVEIKEAGANFVRLCHYPHHPGELDLCDELGLLVMDEIPLYWWNGTQEGEDHHRSKLEASKRQVRKMIRRDINHPAVVFWSVSNENRENRPEVAEGNRQLVRFAKELDPSRLAVHVSDRWRSHPNFCCDDVICVNAYPSLHTHGYDGDYAYDLSDGTRFWRDELHKLHEQYADKPILVSEFGYAALEGVYDGAFGEDTQAEAIAHEFAGMDAPYVCGATVWCWADHPWPAATFEFCRYLGTSPYGVVSRERRKLKAYWRIRRLFREKQGLAGPSRAVAPAPGQAGYELTMIRPDMADIPQVPFPEGFGVRPMRTEEGGLWLDIQRDAEPYFPIADGLFVQQFGHDLEAIQWRGFIVVNDKGVGVGTISAWYNRDFRGQDYGVIHWVAIRPAYQGKGLGKAALSFALNQLAQWHDRCYLGTQSRRHAAIHLYLSAGFVPDLGPPGAIEGWCEVRNALDHPALSIVDGL